MSKSTLEQWRMFRAVVEHGGFAQAAAAIHKSQSSINHAVHKLQSQLNLPLLEVVGRRAQLTDAGRHMLRRATLLLEQASELEAVADGLSAGSEAELRVAVDEIFPQQCLADSLAALSQQFPHTRVELHETILSGGPEHLIRGDVDLLVAGQIPDGFLGEPLMQVEFIAVSQPQHPLQQKNRELTMQDLAAERQIVVRDSSSGEGVDSGWLGADQRWTVSHIETSIAMISRGMGFAWLPATRIGDALAADRLRELPLATGARRHVTLYLTHTDADAAGPAATRLGQLLLEQAQLGSSN